MSQHIDCALVAVFVLTSDKPAEEEETDQAAQAATDLVETSRAGIASHGGEQGQQGDDSYYH